jgi:hypothetical protein
MERFLMAFFQKLDRLKTKLSADTGIKSPASGAMRMF